MTAKSQKQIQFILMNEAINQIHDIIESAMVTHTAEICHCKLKKTGLFCDYQNRRLKCVVVNINVWSSTCGR